MPPATDASNRTWRPARAGEIDQLRPVMRHELLVRGDDRFAGEQRAANPVVGGPQPADELDDDVDVSSENFLRRIGPAHGRGHPIDAFSRDVAVADVRQLHAGHLAAAENARDRLADRTEPEQRHAGTFT